ncbi:D-alanyl-D-alanine carboxypeptidase [Streptomyces phaeochromogenes]
MEEAPVAGESPDRSKQHESSAEPTSGSKAPVPDPRLAVAREAVTAAARVDTATAVFSTKRAAGSSGSAGSDGSEGSAAGSSQGSDGSADRESAGKGPAKGTEGGDARLRDVVAAWVATADDEAPEGASDADDIDGSDDAEGSGAAEGSDGLESDTLGSAGSVGSAGSAGGDAEVPDGAEGAAGESGADEDAESEGAAAAEAPAAEDASGETDGDDAGPVGGADAESESQSEATDEAKDQPEDEPKADADAKADAAPETVGSDESESDADAKADVVSEADAASGADEPADEVPAEAKADAAKTDAVPETGAAPGGDEPADEAPAEAKADAAKADAVPAADADVKTDAEPDADSGSDSDDDPKPPVDQPTAIFKMPKRAVDQPTTMLKLGGAKPGAEAEEEPRTEAASEADSRTDKGTATDPGKGAEPDKSAEGKPAPAWAAKPSESSAPSASPSAEPEAERTSKFVALKPLDEPAPPKARPLAPPAVPPAAETAAIPQVGPERTTQQPLPPKPPLDLLAELTNTPAPRQTPVRTIVRRVKIWTPLVLLLAVVFAVVQAVRPLPTPTLALTADESYAFEGNKVSLPWPGEGQGWMDVNGIGTVDKFGEQKPVAIGSVAKAMTAYVILKEHPLKPGEDGAKIPVDAKAETEGGYDAQGESTLNTVKEGDTLTEKDAIAAIMIPSANNIARLLARWDSNGSEEAFVKKMNDAAKDLGMTNTTYTDPSGLKETTVSSAEDQVKLGNELVRMQALVDITKLPTWVDPSGKKWDNYNRLVPYNNAIGIKTGSTTKAGGNLLFAATQEVGGENVIVVGAVLGQHKPPIIDTVNAVSKEAMIAAQEALTSRKILKKGDVVGYVDDGLGGHTPVVATKDVSAVGWAGQTVKLKLGEDGTTIPNEAKAGTKVGSLSVGDGTSGNAVEVPVALKSDLVEPGYGSKLTRVS